MGKKRRTKREKLAAELRKQPVKSINNSNNIPSNYNTEPEKNPEFNAYKINLPAISNTKSDSNTPTANQVIQDKKYSYVVHDIKKTIVVVCIILILNLGIFTLLGKNIISLKFLGL